MKRIFRGGNNIGQPEDKLKYSEELLKQSAKEFTPTTKGIIGDYFKFNVKKKEEQKDRLVFTLELANNQDQEFAVYKNRVFKVSMTKNDYYNDVRGGSTVKVLGEFSKDTLECDFDKYEDDVFNGYLILDPDKFIQATTLSYCSDCVLKAFHKMAFPAAESEASFPLRLGTMVHNLFDHCIANRKNLHDVNEDYIDRCISENYMELYAVAMNDTKKQHVEEEVDEVLKKVKSKLIHYLDNIKKMVQDNVIDKKPLGGTDYVITSLIATEQKFFSRRLGIVGQVDVTIEVQKQRQNSDKKWIAPIELKSGRDYDQKPHFIQCGIYKLLLYELNCPVNDEGFLVYLDTMRTKVVKLSKADYNELVKNRNRLVFLQENLNKEIFDLEKVDFKKCKYCVCRSYYNVYRKSKNKDIEDIAEPGEPELTTTDIYLKKWNSHIALEQYKTEKKFANDSKTEIGVAEEKNLILESITKNENKWILVMKKAVEIDGRINKGSYVDISCSDNSLLTLGNGSIANKNVRFVNDSIITTISVSLSEVSMLEIAEEKFTLEGIKAKEWNIRCNPQSSTTYGIMRWALATFCQKEECKKQRQLIIDFKTPDYDNFNYSLSGLIDKYPDLITTLSAAQLHAILKALACIDYQLIFGVAGSGRSYVIAALLEILSKEGFNVLYTANTDTRIDKTLKKLMKKQIKFHHVASSKDYLQPEVRDYISSYIPIDRIGYKEYLEAALKVKIVAATAYSLTKDILRLKEFDYCIIDNAPQISEMICLGGILLSKKFIMIGDAGKQLALYIKATNDDESKQSLFMKLSGRHPENLAKLYEQYTMSEGIMNFLNEAIYKGCMVQGLEELKDYQLAIPKKEETYV